MERIKNVIFDLDGTLLNTLDDIVDSANYVLKKYNLKERTTNEIKMFVGNGIPMLMHRAVGNSTDEETEKNIIADMLSWYKTHSNIKTRPYDNISEMLAALKKNGISMAVVTNKDDDAAKLLVREMFDDVFDFVQGDNKVLPLKPDPSVVLSLMERLNGDRENTIFVGDSDVDILTAKNAKLTSIGCLWGFRDEKTLKSSGAEYIIEEPMKIADIVLKNPLK